MTKIIKLTRSKAYIRRKDWLLLWKTPKIYGILSKKDAFGSRHTLGGFSYGKIIELEDFYVRGLLVHFAEKKCNHIFKKIHCTNENLEELMK